jgi:hypothetical protein
VEWSATEHHVAAREQRRSRAVGLHRQYPNPPNRGGPFPVALQLTVDLNTIVGLVGVGAATIGKAFLEELGKEGAKALRQKMLKIPVLGPGPREDLSRIPVSLMIGTVQVYIDSPMTEEELAIALQRATKLVAKMPEERVNNPSGASGWPITWDSMSQSWKDALNP